MNKITKEKLINTIINDCKELDKVYAVLYTEEFKWVIEYRVFEVYNLNYKMTQETKLFIIDFIVKYCYENMTDKQLKNKLVKLIK